jgi:hypothetical protein
VVFELVEQVVDLPAGVERDLGDFDLAVGDGVGGLSSGMRGFPAGHRDVG